MTSAVTTVRAADVMAVVACATDFAKGFPEDQALRTCRIAVRLGGVVGADDEDIRTIFFVSLLRFVGCTATSSEMAAALGDEFAVSAAFAAVDERDLRSILRTTIRTVGTDRGAFGRARSTLGFLAAAPRVIREHEVASCEVATLFAVEAGLHNRVQTALGQVFERFDGRGNPGVAAGDGIDQAVRIEQVANLVELVSRVNGWHAVQPALARQAGRRLDPAIAAALISHASSIREAAETPVDLDDVLELEPRPWIMYDDDALDRALTAVGAVADLKSVFTRGHSSGVAARAASGAIAVGLPAGDIELVRRAAWLHDIGRVAVSSATWECPRTLTDAQWEAVRLHPYIGERVLARRPALAALGALVGGHHERADGSGYYRGLAGAQLAAPVALLAAADVVQALGEDRPHRPAMTQAERHQTLRAEIDQGRLAQWAVDAVTGDGARSVGILEPHRGRRPSPLTSREQEVLALVARGATNHRVAEALSIAPKTVNAHLEHIFTKLGVTTRGAAAFQAVQNEWLAR